MHKIGVVNFGCQYTHQIGESVRRAGVYSEILPCTVDYDALSDDFTGFVLSGSPDSVNEPGSKRCDPRFFSGDKPALGICYGMQLTAHELGGKVGKGRQGEYGEGRIRIANDSPLFRGFDGSNRVWMSHGDSVLSLPKGFETIAFSEDGLIAAMSDERRSLYGLQFHPEVSNTDNGDQILRNFAVDICRSNREWSTGSYIDDAIERIREQVGGGYAIVFVSGGVDSSVAAVLARRALGDRLRRAIHVDNGLERKCEANFVRELLGNAGMDVEVIDRNEYMLGKIGRTLLPEKKRHIIGDAFIEILYDEASGFRDDDSAYLIQGTIYPDSIESGDGVGGGADTIKSHHNVSSKLVRELREKGRVVEPNVLLFKYETREVARLLGLPPEISERHPFPGPGLGVRYVGRVLMGERHEDDCRMSADILSEYGLDGVVVPIGNVGVKGSARAYGSVVLMNGEREQYEACRKAANRLGNSVPGVTRAALVLDGEPHTQNEWDDIRPMHFTRDRLGILRDADNIAMSKLEEYGLYGNVSQMPVVLFPGPGKKPWIALRPVVTPDFMTLRPPEIPKEMTWDYLDDTTEGIMGSLPVGGVVLDTTNKPPATTEWE